MHRRLILPLLILLSAACGRSPSDVFGEGPRRIIVVSLDTLGAKHLECYGYHRVTAPNITGVAEAGVRFAQVTAPSNWTLPSHVSLFTGLYPARHGVRREHHELDDGPVHMVESLRDAGFATAAFTGGAYLAPRHGLDRGFDHYVSEEQWDHSTDDSLAKARVWLGDHRDQDFFLFLHTYEIHAPYTAPNEWVRRYTEGRRSGFRGLIVQLQEMKKKERIREQDIRIVVDHYDAGIAWTDHMLGGFLDWLAAEGLDENLLLLISSDHGEEFWEHGDHSHGGDLLGNEVTQVPLIVRLPDGSAAGSVVDHEASFMDIMPTVLDAAGVGRPSDLDGYSLLPEMIGRPVAPEDREARARRLYDPARSDHSVGLCEGEHFTAAQTRRWKAVTPRPDADASAHALWPALFDLAADPGEADSLAPSGDVMDLLTGAVDRLVGSGKGQQFIPPDAAELDEAARRQLEALGY